MLTEEQVLARDMARDFARRELAPRAAEWSRERRVPHDVLAEMGALGLMGMCVPEEWGGAGVDFVAYALALQEIAAGDGGVSTVMSVNKSPVCAALLEYGSPAQKERYLKPLARGEAIGCFLLTEPQAGSDASALRTRARLAGNKWVLNGTKQFITSGRTAKIAMIFAVTDPAAGKKGITCFLTPTDAPGFRVARVEDKLGQHSSDTCQIALEDLEVAPEDILGEPGQGYRVALANLSTGRIGIAAQAVGMARAAYEAALDYARQREAFGKPIVEHQAVAFRLADMATELEAAHRMTLHAAALKAQGASCLREASMAKLYASEMAERVCSAAIQVHGGYGYLADCPVERIWRDVRVTQIYEGTSDVQKLVIVRELSEAPQSPAADLALSDEQRMVRDAARDFARREIRPHVRAWEAAGAYDPAILRRMGELGLMGVCVPPEWGGAGADFVSYILAMEEVAAEDAGVANVMSAANSPVGAALLQEGTEEQKRRFLRPVAAGEMAGAILLTEPQAGSDAANLKTTARLAGGRWVLNGTKQFITAGKSSGVAMILAVTDPAAGRKGITCFLAPTDAKGYRVARLEKKLGHRTCDTAQIELEDLEVPQENVLGKPGDGYRIALANLNTGRIAVAAQAIGAARAAFEAALAYAKQREAFGQPLIGHQAVAFKLADMATQIEVARQLTLHAARAKQAGEPAILEASMAKLFASEMAERVCSAAIQLHGGYGYVEDFPVEKLWRDVRVTQIYEGSSEIQRLLIARQLAAS
jgi:alkylation response protein AidB-like acyl-CoA dehydrogenase